MTSGSGDFVKRFASVSLGVDMTNTKEVEMLKEVLVAWPEEMGELEIFFKNKNPSMEEGESSIGGTHENFWEDRRQLPNTDFHAFTVWLINFSGSQEEFALASFLITQGLVVRTLVINPPSVFKKLEIQAVLAKLKKIPKGHKELSFDIWY